MAKRKMKPLFITGANGFIGSHLCNYLEKADIPFYKNEIDLLHAKKLHEFFQKNTFQTAIHLAGRFEGSFEELTQSNSIATWNFCEAFSQKNSGSKKIIFSSSGAVYGIPVNGHESFEVDIPHPETSYGLVKFLSEEVIRLYSRTHNLDHIILRLPNVYGEGGKGIINKIKNDITQKGLVTINGNGDKSRDLMYVGDVVHAITSVALADIRRSDTFNLSSGNRLSVNEILAVFSSKHSFTVQHVPDDNTTGILHLNSRKIYASADVLE